MLNMIETNDIMNVLRNISLFEGLPEKGLEEVLTAAQVVKIPADSFLFYQDDPVQRVYAVLAGRIKLIQLSADGQQVLLRLGTPGMLIAAIGMVPGGYYPVTAQAAEDTTLLSWTQQAMFDLIERYPQMAFKSMKILAGHVREFQDRYRELATERVERRLAQMILRLVDQVGKKTPDGVLLDMPLTRQDLAEMIGTTLFTVSRILTQWENLGYVETGRERIVVKSPQHLLGISEDLPKSPA